MRWPLAAGTSDPDLPLPISPGRPRFRDLDQIVGHDPPSHPPAHPARPVISASLQAEVTPQRVDPALDPRPELIAPAESTPLLQLLPLRRRLAHPRQRHLLDARLPGQFL